MQFPNPTLLGANDIILANPLVMNPEKMQPTEEDSLDALKMGTEDDANMDIFLNL